MAYNRMEYNIIDGNVMQCKEMRQDGLEGNELDGN
jgi:hypothetical protein